MKQLGSFTLPPGTQWPDRFNWTGVATDTARTIAGTALTWTAPLTGGQPITLTFERKAAWLTLEQVTTLQTMAKQPGAVYALTWEEETRNVIITSVGLNRQLPFNVYFGKLTLLGV